MYSMILVQGPFYLASPCLPHTQERVGCEIKCMPLGLLLDLLKLCATVFDLGCSSFVCGGSSINQKEIVIACFAEDISFKQDA